MKTSLGQPLQCSQIEITTESHKVPEQEKFSHETCIECLNLKNLVFSIHPGGNASIVNMYTV